MQKMSTPAAAWTAVVRTVVFALQAATAAARSAVFFNVPNEWIYDALPRSKEFKRGIVGWSASLSSHDMIEKMPFFN